MLSTSPPAKTSPPNRAPIDFECDVNALPLIGKIPLGLSGTLVRNGPNPLIADPRAHWFSGDGMLHAFRIQDGHVSYRNRWVRTGQLELERLTGRNPHAEGLAVPDDIRLDGSANTNVVRHAGRLVALEEAHPPIEMEEHTLETLGPIDFDGSLPSAPFTAHPHADPATGELLFFGYNTPDRLSTGMSYGVLSPAGRVTRYETFEAPYASMVHDFAITERHVIFPIMPLIGSAERMKAGGPPYAWEPEHGTRVGIMPRSGSVQDIEWWQGPACYVFHVMNAWEEGDDLYLDVMQFERPPLFPLPDGRPAAGPGEPAKLTRWHFDLRVPGRSFTSRTLAKVPGEFPRIDERFTGRPYKHGWYVGNLPEPSGDIRMGCALVHIDHSRPEPDMYVLPPGDRTSEAVFVPRDGSAPEGDGWLLAVLYRAATHTSELAVFDARQVSAGPLCLAVLGHRVPDGFHGNWLPNDGAVP